MEGPAAPVRFPDDLEVVMAEKFEVRQGQLVCRECRCLVRKKKGDALAHITWHELLVIRLREARG